MMEKRSCAAFVLVLHLSWVSAGSSNFARNGGYRHGVALLQSETNPEMLPSSKHPKTLSERAQEIRSSEQEEEEDRNQMGVSKVGSRPPRCEDKCYGCTPCEATHPGHAHVGVQYTNYEPEGWKCKCGPSLYAP